MPLLEMFLLSRVMNYVIENPPPQCVVSFRNLKIPKLTYANHNNAWTDNIPIWTKQWHFYLGIYNSYLSVCKSNSMEINYFSYFSWHYQYSHPPTAAEVIELKGEPNTITLLDQYNFPTAH